MTYQEYQDLKQSILSDATLTELVYKNKLTDEDGEQMLVSKIEYTGANGTIVQVFNYSGGTMDFALQGITESIVLPDSTIINEVFPQ